MKAQIIGIYEADFEILYRRELENRILDTETVSQIEYAEIDTSTQEKPLAVFSNESNIITP